MLTKDHKSSVFSPRPHTFADLMEMYEANYIRLRLLCGDIKKLPAEKVSSIKGGVPVSIKVLEQTRHTTTVMLTYLFNQQDIEDHQHRFERRPDLEVRIYHDSRQAEVISRKCKLKDYYPVRAVDLDDKGNVLLCRWRLNRFLYKWAGYIHRQGHSFK